MERNPPHPMFVCCLPPGPKKVKVVGTTTLKTTLNLAGLKAGIYKRQQTIVNKQNFRESSLSLISRKDPLFSETFTTNKSLFAP